MGGGHGPNSNHFGLGVDNVLEHEVVLPNGRIVIANEESYPDLFWALRGGGGSTFGILTRVTVMAHDHPKTPAVALGINRNKNLTDSAEVWVDAMTYYLSNMPEFTDFGLTGYPNLSPDSYSGVLTAPNRTIEEILAFLDPIIDTLKTKYQQEITLQGADGGLDDSFYLSTPNEQAGAGIGLASRLLSREGIKNTTLMRTALAHLFTLPLTIIEPYPVAGGQVAKNRDLHVGLNPAWRDAIMHFIVTGISVSMNKTSMDTLYSTKLASASAVLDPMSVDSGNYFNEVCSPFFYVDSFVGHC
jgi:hypothetical protein